MKRRMSDKEDFLIMLGRWKPDDFENEESKAGSAKPFWSLRQRIPRYDYDEEESKAGRDAYPTTMQSSPCHLRAEKLEVSTIMKMRRSSSQS
jgi:hypothetical protein